MNTVSLYIGCDSVASDASPKSRQLNTGEEGGGEGIENMLKDADTADVSPFEIRT